MGIAFYRNLISSFPCSKQPIGATIYLPALFNEI
jgi:hypothetical protein